MALQAPTAPATSAPAAPVNAPAPAALMPGAMDVPPVPTAPFEPCPANAAGLVLCDSFENDAAGAFPMGGPWLGELVGCGTHSIDASGVSASGSQALVGEAGGYPECMLHAALEDAQDVYVRSRVRLGADPELLEQYLSLVELGPREAQDDPELRIGLRPPGGSLCASAPGLDVSVSGLTSGTATACSGLVLAPERWYCIEAHVARNGPSLDYSLSVDGVELVSQIDMPLGPAWTEGALYLKLGRAAYGQSPVGSVWHDDVAVGREPLPCGP